MAAPASMPVPSAWQNYQTAAQTRWQQSAVPTVKDEAWRYTSLAAVPVEAWARIPVPSETIHDLPDGVTITPLPSLSETEFAALDLPAPAHLNALVALNAAQTQEAFLLRIAANTHLTDPLLLHLQNPVKATNQILWVIELGANSNATILQQHESGAENLTNLVMHIRINDNAHLQHYRWLNDDKTAMQHHHLQVQVGRDASYDTLAFTTGGQINRNEVHVILGGTGAHATVNAAYIAGKNQLVDNTSIIRHAAPHGTSRQTVKAVIGAQGKGVFQGRIEVAREAQKTDGYQLNQALLLADNAESNSKPELEIFADDVKCSHGATIGQLDAKALFYLRSRGIPEAQARELLIHAFIADVFDEVRDETIRHAMLAQMQKVLAQL